MANSAKKGIAGLIVELHSERKPPVDEEDEGDDEGLEAAAQELLDAVEAKDASGVAEALRHAIAICG